VERFNAIYISNNAALICIKRSGQSRSFDGDEGLLEASLGLNIHCPRTLRLISIVSREFKLFKDRFQGFLRTRSRDFFEITVLRSLVVDLGNS
jgi:hypothetical protein